MNYYVFKKDDDNFEDFLNDKNLKPLLKFKIQFKNHLILATYDVLNEKLQSYVTLKYGDYMVNKKEVFGDYTPVPFKDYIPDRKRPSKFKKL